MGPVEALDAELMHHLSTIQKKELSSLHGRGGEWDTLVSELLEQHYDPAYSRSTLKHYPHYAQGLVLTPHDLGEAAMPELAHKILAGQKN